MWDLLTMEQMNQDRLIELQKQRQAKIKEYQSLLGSIGLGMFGDSEKGFAAFESDSVSLRQFVHRFDPLSPNVLTEFSKIKNKYT